MFKADSLQKLQNLLLYLLAFAIPFPFIFFNLALAGLIVVWVLLFDLKETKQLFRNLYQRKILLAYIAYFALFALSYFYSDNKAQSSFDTGSKLFLLILPVIIGAGLTIDKRHLQNIFFAFVLGVTVTALSSVATAFTQWQTSGDVGNFFYHRLVDELDANAVYEALYTFFSICLLLMYKWRRFFNGSRRFIKYLLLAIHIIFFLMLSARMLLLLSIIFLVPYYLVFVFRTRITARNITIGAGIFAVVFCCLVFFENPIKDRFEDFFSKKSELAFLDDYTNVKEEEFNTFTLRLLLWRIGIENIAEKNLWLTGCGNGDAQAMQNNKLKEYGLRNFHEELEARSPLYNINLHNMYLQSLIMVGVLGLILLIYITTNPFFIYKKKLFFKIFIPFHVSTIFFMMQEAMFQTQAGLAYYTFFSIIYYNFYYNNKNVTL